MENSSIFSHKEDENMELPPGFRFHPTDEELITHYLSRKVLDTSFDARAIGEVDLNKCEPWDLPRRAKMGEKEWYFFCVRDRKYPTGLRTNRATDAGYWKATGKDKEIYRAKMLVGMKKTLVFYTGRAPKGSKTDWVMHEYRLEGKYSAYNLPKTAKNEWVICRVFQKSSGGKKTHLSGLVRQLPPLTDSSPRNSETWTNPDLSHVTCFSNAPEDQKSQDDVVDSSSHNTSSVLASSSSSNMLPSSFLSSQTSPPANSFFPPQISPNITNFQYPDTILMSDQSARMFLGNNGLNMKPNPKIELSQDAVLSTDMSSGATNNELVQSAFDDKDPSSSAAPVYLEYLWNYQI